MLLRAPSHQALHEPGWCSAPVSSSPSEPCGTLSSSFSRRRRCGWVTRLVEAPLGGLDRSSRCPTVTLSSFPEDGSTCGRSTPGLVRGVRFPTLASDAPHAPQADRAAVLLSVWLPNSPAFPIPFLTWNSSMSSSPQNIAWRPRRLRQFSSLVVRRGPTRCSPPGQHAYRRSHDRRVLLNTPHRRAPL